MTYWLKDYDFQPELVEKRADLNDEGYMIDFHGSGFAIAEKMGLRESLETRHSPVSELRFVDPHGRAQATLDIQTFRKLLKYRHFNFKRGDLAAVLLETIQTKMPICFGTSLMTVDNLQHGVLSLSPS